MDDKTGIAWTDATWARFIARIDRRGDDECWTWTAGMFSNSYGQFRLGAHKVRAHRAYYARVVGPIPDGLRVLHRCDNPPCCNPSHLFLGTDADNAADRSAKGRSSRNGCSQPGERNPAAKIDSTAAATVRALRESGNTMRSIAERVGISQSQVCNIVAGRSWK